MMSLLSMGPNPQDAKMSSSPSFSMGSLSQDPREILILSLLSMVMSRLLRDPNPFHGVFIPRPLRGRNSLQGYPGVRSSTELAPS